MHSTVSRLIAAAAIAATLAATLALAVTAAAAPAAAPAPSTETANDTARFLAGLPPAPDSPLAALAKSSGTWAEHARVFDAIFARIDTNTLSKVRAFGRDHLTPPHDTMLYMFSGPDFLFATSFFPSASTYVLAGLEPVGPIPQLMSLPRGAVEGTLHNLERSTATLLNVSFFITKDMATQLSAGPVYGTLPVLLVFMARTGKTIHEVELVNLDGQGNVVPVDEKSTPERGGRPTPKGVKIVFSDGDKPRQTLYYFSTDLSDSGIKSSGFLEFCEKLGPADSFIKSASYLLHGSNFSRARSFLLDHSATLLQDDSGVPVTYFDSKKWRLQPYGHYLAPLSIFPGAYQPRAAELFRNAAPLDFGLGYRWRPGESNLLLAQRQPPGADAEADVNHTSTTTPDTPPVGAESARPHRTRPRTVARPPQPDGLRGFFSTFGGSDSASASAAPRYRPPH
jgi:hypothetical protein